MADTYTTRVRAEKPEVNANDGTWGDELNANTFDILDEAIAGVVSKAVSGSNITLSANNGSADESRNPVLILTGTPGATREISYPDVEGWHWVFNNTDATQTIKAGAGTSVSILSGFIACIYTDGATNAVALLNLNARTGGQIVFPATQNASANANTLDDYEEGTWTPSLQFGGAAVSMTYGTQLATYTKIGQRVDWEFSIVLTAKGSSSGNATVAGLPFSPGGGGVAFRAYGIYTLVDLNVAGGFYSPASVYATTTITLQEQGDNVTQATLTEADFQNTSGVHFGGSYVV